MDRRQSIQIPTKLKLEQSQSASNFKTFLLYRQLQILYRFYNLIQHDVLLTSTIFLVANGPIVSAYVLIANGSSVTFEQLFMFLNGGVNCFFIALVQLGAMAKLYGESSRVIRDVKKLSQSATIIHPNILMEKWLKRYLKSLTPLVAKMGSVNFLDKLTPVTILNFCLVQIVNLLLL